MMSLKSSTSTIPVAGEAKSQVNRSKTILNKRQVTVEGFRTLSVLAIFLAGLQASLLSVSLAENSTTVAKLVNAFWLAGVFLDVFGAVLATLAARWFEVLDDEDMEHLHNAWSTDPALLPLKKSSLLMGFVQWVIATSLFSGMGVVACGAGAFLLGLLIYTWDRQPLVVAVIATVPVVVLSPLVAVCFVPHSDGKKNIINILAKKRGAW